MRILSQANIQLTNSPENIVVVLTRAFQPFVKKFSFFASSVFSRILSIFSFWQLFSKLFPGIDFSPFTDGMSLEFDFNDGTTEVSRET